MPHTSIHIHRQVKYCDSIVLGLWVLINRSRVNFVKTIIAVLCATRKSSMWSSDNSHSICLVKGIRSSFFWCLRCRSQRANQITLIIIDNNYNQTVSWEQWRCMLEQNGVCVCATFLYITISKNSFVFKICNWFLRKDILIQMLYQMFFRSIVWHTTITPCVHDNVIQSG